jgi:hypothetical protein
VDEEIQLASKALAQKFGITFISDEEFNFWKNDASRSLYLCDVRTAEEFAKDGLSGAQNTQVVNLYKRRINLLAFVMLASSCMTRME